MEIERIGKPSVEKSQKIIIDYYKNNKTNGIFYVPELDVYSADILVKNTHPIIVVDEGEDLKGHKVEYIENDSSLGYLIGEIMFVFNKQVIGSIYEYKIDDIETHSHTFKEVLVDCCEYEDRISIITEYESYSKQELELIEYTSNYRDLRLSKRFLKFPYILKGKEAFTNDVEELYVIVLNNFNDIVFNFDYDDNKHYNNNQIEAIKAIITYQKYEEEKFRKMEVDIKTKLYHGLPDSRIYKAASKITVLSYNGTEIVIKDRGLETEGKVILDESYKYEDLDVLAELVEFKDVTIYPEFYSNKEVRKILGEI